MTGKANFMSAVIERPDLPPVAGYATAEEAATTMHLVMPSVVLARSAADQTWQPSEFPMAYVLDEHHKVVQTIPGADAAVIASALSAKFGLTG